MKLSLDHVQRLNLHALMGAQRASVDEVRMWWRLQDRIALDEDEKQRINYRMGKVGEVEQPVWDFAKRLPLREFEFTDEEFSKLERIIKEWQHGFMASGDRGWLEPLLAQFETRVNGGANQTPIPARHRA